MSLADMPVNDYDQHYYEAIDAFTRHLDPKLGQRIIQWCDIGGRKYHVIGGKVSHAVVNPTFDPVSPAGAMAEYFRGNPSGKSPLEFLKEREPIRPEYRDRDARLRGMDEQGIEKIWLFPTLGMIYEELLKDDPQGVGLMFQAFNRWLEEDWGYGYQDRIYAAPYIALADIDMAVAELERALSLGATTVVMRPAAPNTVNGRRTPAHEDFDPFWARVNEAGITVVAHAGDSGYGLNGYGNEGFSASFGEGARKPTIGFVTIERAIYDFLGVADVRQALRPLPERPRRRRWRTAPSTSATCSRSSAPSRARSRATGPRTRSRRSSATCGSTRSGRTTSTRSSSTWAPTGWCSAPTGRTSRACPRRATTSWRSRSSTRTPSVS